MYVNSRVCKIQAGAGEEYAVVGLIAEKTEVRVLEMIEEYYIRSDLLWEKRDKIKR